MFYASSAARFGHTPKASLLLVLSVLMSLLSGCDTISRSQGQFMVTGYYAEGDVRLQTPLDEALYVPDIENGVPLIRIAYRTRVRNHIVDFNDEKDSDKYGHDYYMQVDITNLVRYPSLGAAENAEMFEKRLKLIAETLLIAADNNGEQYWRSLTAFLQTYGSLNTTGEVALGGAIPAAFISPVLGASLAGGALVIDTFVQDYVSGLDINDYAALRDATSTYRAILKGKIYEAIEGGEAGKATVDQVLQLTYDYAFTYSIKGAIHAAVQQNEQLQSLLTIGSSSWEPFFKEQILKNKKHEIEMQLADPGLVDAQRNQLEEALKSINKQLGLTDDEEVDEE